MEGLASFIVAAPEGFWCYRLDRNREELVHHFSHQELLQNDVAIREFIIGARSSSETAILGLFQRQSPNNPSTNACNRICFDFACIFPTLS
jgi:hypothetical protein